MELRKNNYCIILAGGRGRRLWPSSRNDCPKQFVDFFGTGKTQLQSTFERIGRILPCENIYICTCKEYEHWVFEQIPGIRSDHVLSEPVNRNTAPSVAWAGVRIHRECEDARVVIVPSDQIIVGEEAFVRNVSCGLEFVARNDIMLTMGISPSRPEPGYGYIQMGEPVQYESGDAVHWHSGFNGIYEVKSFTEKPEREFAQFFMESGEFLWNTGMFLSNLQFLHDFFVEVIKDMPYRMAAVKDMPPGDEELQYVNLHYPSYPNLSMDKAALELSDKVCVMRCDFGWADLGTWHSIYECMQKTESDNVVIDSEVIMENCSGNVVKLPKGHIGVINGLDGYIVAEQGDVLLICKKGDSSSLIRKYASEVGIRYGEKYI